MDNKDDIKKLLDRFMDGLTTPDEEDCLASYFRSGKAPAEWRDYSEMFAYFDEGMPENRYGQRSTRRSKRAVVALGMLAVAAAVAFLLVVVLPQGGNAGLSPAPVASAVTATVADTVRAESPTDTVPDVAEPSEQPRRRTIYKYKYSPEPPRGYLAEAVAEAKTDTMESMDALVAEQIGDMEQQQRAVAMQADMMARLHEMLVNTGMDGDLAADNEEIY